MAFYIIYLSIKIQHQHQQRQLLLSRLPNIKYFKLKKQKIKFNRDREKYNKKKRVYTFNENLN